MVMCFAPDCKHYNERDLCRFFRFPKDEKVRKRWIKLVRRGDKVPNNNSVLCSCHFKDGLKENGPTIFEHNAKRRLEFPSPEKRHRKRTNTGIPAEAATATVLTEVEAEKENIPNECAVAAAAFKTTGSVLVEAENTLLQTENKMLREMLNKSESSFCFEHIKCKDDLVMLFTGLPNKEIFYALYDYLKNIDREYYLEWTVTGISDQDQLFMCLYKLRLNTPHKEVAVRFNCSPATVTNVFMTWLHLLHELLYGQLMANVPSRHNNSTCLPNCFFAFPNTRIVLDCTEIFSEVPQSIKKQRELYSHYKHRNTLKGLVGVAPNGVVTFVSELYSGSTSDKLIVQDCGILNLLEAGDLILADKGFLISDILPAGVSINVPPFLLQPQFTPEQVLQTKSIARARIHVERAIQRIKGYSILDVIPQNLREQSTIIWQVCSALINFQYPLLKEVEMFYKQPNST